MNPNSTPAQSPGARSPDEAQRHAMDKAAQARSDAAGRGAGLPARAPQLERKPTDSPFTPKEASLKSSMRLPHERDESAAMTGSDGSGRPSPRMATAAEDLAAGRKDTSRANETDQAYHRLHESPAQGPAPAKPHRRP